MYLFAYLIELVLCIDLAIDDFGPRYCNYFVHLHLKYLLPVLSVTTFCFMIMSVGKN